MSPPKNGIRQALSICLINPKFEPSYWGHDFALPLLPGQKRCWTVTGALPALAGLVPDGHSVELLDENLEPIDFERLRRFDIIGVTGMIVQRQRMREILVRLRPLPAIIAVGGPYISVQPDALDDLCDVRFVGEAEETWPEFLNAVAEGRPTRKLYAQANRTDMTKAPPPRYDLLKADRYVAASVQFSRGCPFLCEFCDIITIFGRRPRVKTAAQFLIELDAIRSAGFRLCFIVDDNFVGNKRAAKELLRAIVAWQRERGYPLQFYTEASVDLAEDPELMDLMVEANLLQIFVGIESPRVESLNETKKIQNTRGSSLMDKITRIRDAGLVVTAGFIVGFDHDDERIFDEQFAFIQSAGIAQAGVAILTPVPTTPLYDRLRAENRLDFSDPDVIFIPRQMSREQLKAGRERLLLRLYEPNAFFERLLNGYASSESFRARRAKLAKSIGRPSRWFGGMMPAALTSFRLASTLLRAGRLRELGWQYLRIYIRRNRALGRQAIPFRSFVVLCALHWHYFNMSRHKRKMEIGAVDTPRTVGLKVIAG